MNKMAKIKLCMWHLSTKKLLYFDNNKIKCANKNKKICIYPSLYKIYKINFFLITYF